MGGNGSITESHGEGVGRERARGEREGGTKMLPQSSEREKTLPHVSERGHFPDLKEREREDALPVIREREVYPPDLRQSDVSQISEKEIPQRRCSPDLKEREKTPPRPQ